MRKFLSLALVLFAFQYVSAETVELLREGFGNTDWYYGAAKDYTGYTGGIKGQNQILKLQKFNASTGYSNASGGSHAVFTPADATNPSSEFVFIINTLGYQNIHLSLGVFSWGAPKDHFVFEYSTNGTDYTVINKDNLIDGTAWDVGKWILVTFGDNLPESATLHVRIKDGTNEQIHFDDVVIKADPKPAYKSVLGDWETIFPANGVYPGKVHLFGLASEVVDNPLPASTVNATSKVLKVTRPAGTWHLLGFELPGGLPVSKVKKIEFQVYSPVLKSVYAKLVGGKNTTLNKDSIFTSITFPWTKNSSAASGTNVINTDWNTITLNMYEANEDMKILSGEGKGKVLQVFVNPTSKTDPNSTWYPLEVDITQQDFYIDNLVIYLNEEVLLDSVRVDKITLAKGATTRAVPAVFPLYTSANKNISWSTAASAVATVDATGLVTAVGGGSTKLQLSLAGNAVEGDLVVTAPVTGINLNKTATTINKGATETLTATVAPDDANNKNVIWTSSDEAIATVANGVVTAVAKGTATITAKTEDGNFEATCSVEVKVAATGISLNATTASVDKDQTVTLTATVAPADANNKNVIWTSSNEAIATVTNGVVTGVAKGTVTITAKSEDGNFEATCQVTVLDNTSTELVSANGIGLYPNPASEVVTVTVNENGTLVIIDLLGAQVASQQVFAGSQTVELNGLTAGTYMVQFKARSGKTVVSKLIVK